MGIVLGAFVAWSAVDIYLGLPIPFQPILFTVGIDLALCYLMIYCFDLGKQRKSTTRTVSTQTRRGEEDKSEIEFDYDEDDEDDEDDEEEDNHYRKVETAMIC